jgi:hypothetical protein
MSQNTSACRSSTFCTVSETSGGGWSMSPMPDPRNDTLMRMAAFEHVRRLAEIHDHLTASELTTGFPYLGERVPLANPRRGIFKPQQMRFLLSIKTVFPKPGGRVWYDDQRDVHRQIFEGDESIDYAFMGQDPGAADNRWLLEAFQNRVPIIYFLGIAPGRYQAMLPAFISGWEPSALKARVVFGMIDPDYRLHVSDRLLAQNDGPMLESLKRISGELIHPPRREKDLPDRDRLALRFERFKAAL